MLVLQCECGKTLTAPEGTTARKGVCPNCGKMLDLPRPPRPAVSAPRSIAQMLGHQGPVRFVAFSPDGSVLATVGGSEENTEPGFAEIHLWDVATQRELIAMQGHHDAVLCAAFTPDGQTLVTGSQDQTLIVWNVSRGLHNVIMGLKEHTLRGHGGAVSSVSISPDGSRLVSASDDGDLFLWNTANWHCEQTAATDRTGLCRLAHSADGSLLAAVWRSRGPAIIWEAPKHEEALRLALRADEDGPDYDLAFSPDGAFLAVLSTNLVRVWDVASCQVMIAIDAPGTQSLAFSPDGRMLATGGHELKTKFDVQLWDPQTGESLGRLNGQHNSLNTVRFSPAGDLLACGGRDLAVHLWEL
jgi:WD40 repeat protein